MKWPWLRYPVLHFVLIGLTLFGARALWPPSKPTGAPEQRQPIVISAERIRAMQVDFLRRWGMEPSPEQTSALIAQTVDEELLYREARVLALDLEDGSVRRRLVEKMRLVSDRPGRSPDELVREAYGIGLDDDVVIRRLLIEKMRILLAQNPTAPQPTETELRGFLDRHRDRFEQPAELTFSHVFLSESARGADLADDARAVLSQLLTRPPRLPGALERSDPFPLGLQLRAYSPGRLTARFGKAFADQVFALLPGAWSSPIASPYGLHLVWIEEKTAPRLPGLDAVREQVTQGVQAERSAAQFVRAMVRVCELYDIRVEGRDDLSTPNATLASQLRP